MTDKEPTLGGSLGSTPTGPPPKRSSASRYLPIVVVVLILAGVLVAVVASSGGDDDDGGTSQAIDDAPRSDPDRSLTLEGAVSWDDAVADGSTDDIDWGERCDTEIGRVAVPLFPQQQCFQPFTGDNGGETAPGVTADSIKIVVYLAQPDDPILKFVYSQIENDDTPEQVFQTYQDYVAMFSNYLELYGRKIDLIRFDATGNISDTVAAVADAEAIANDIQPFMVLGGPLLTNAFADTLAANKVACVACTPPQPNDWYADRAPYVWDIDKNAEQNQMMVAEYIGKRLAGGTADHAGTGVQGKPRVFGYVHIVASDSDQILEDKFTARLKDDYDVTFAQIERFESPIELAGTGRDLITRLKEAGVTTVVYSGDPLAPQTLTKIATDQDYWPEWIITGTVLVDTTAFSRSYDQAQWAHAFGPSNLFARVSPQSAGSVFVYRWYYGKEPAADASSNLALPNVQFMMNPLQAIGPEVTHDNFMKVLFGSKTTQPTPITPQISYGNRGVWPDPDFNSLDDQTEVWWDPEATGEDELFRVGKGMYRYVDGGKRYAVGSWPESKPKVFDPEGTVTVYEEAPEEARISADYVPIK